LERHVARFVDQMAELYEREGFAPIAGRVFARLLLSPEPMALGDLARDLRVSKASVSTETRRLEGQRVLERVTRPGDRRVFYRIAEDLPARIMDVRLERMRRFRSLLGQGRRRLPSDARGLRARLRECERAYTAFLKASKSALELWRREQQKRGAVRTSDGPRTS
jgi:DNA-binding transcriptional regulator GbsR (MarR family)